MMHTLVLAAEAVEAVEADIECGLFDVGCRVGNDVAAGFGGDRIREMFLSMASGVLEWAATWWSEVPAFAGGDDFTSRMRWYMMALAAVLLVLGIVVQGGRMIWMRRAAPLVDTVSGLSTYVLATGVAVPVTAGALLAGDAFAAWVLQDAVEQQVAAEVVFLLALTPELGVVVLLGLLAALTGVALAAAMMLREVSILLLAGTIPLAAAGRLVPGLGHWLPSMLRLVLALVLWKPAAALVYAAGARLMIDDEPRSLLVGVVTLMLTVAALPALIRWFTPLATGAVGRLTGAAGAASGQGARLVARGPTVQQQVAQIERDFGSPAGRRVPPPGARVGTATIGRQSGHAAAARSDGPLGIAGHHSHGGPGIGAATDNGRVEEAEQLALVTEASDASASPDGHDHDENPLSPYRWGTPEGTP